MLRITSITEANRGQTLKLEGRLLGPWVGEVREACARAAAGSQPLRLDLSGVRFVDGAGAELLRELLLEGVPLVACSSFVAALLRLEE
jgi:anti-anti-sigma regulatory factor